MALKGTLLWQPQESSTLTLAKVGNDNVFGVHHVLQEKWESGSPVLYGTDVQVSGAVLVIQASWLQSAE